MYVLFVVLLQSFFSYLSSFNVSTDLHFLRKRKDNLQTQSNQSKISSPSIIFELDACLNKSGKITQYCQQYGKQESLRKNGVNSIFFTRRQLGWNKLSIGGKRGLLKSGENGQRGENVILVKIADILVAEANANERQEGPLEKRRKRPKRRKCHSGQNR